MPGPGAPRAAAVQVGAQGAVRIESGWLVLDVGGWKGARVEVVAKALEEALLRVVVVVDLVLGDFVTSHVPGLSSIMASYVVFGVFALRPDDDRADARTMRARSRSVVSNSDRNAACALSDCRAGGVSHDSAVVTAT